MPPSGMRTGDAAQVGFRRSTEREIHLAGSLDRERQDRHVEERAIRGIPVREFSVVWLQPLAAPTIIVACGPRRISEAMSTT